MTGREREKHSKGVREREREREDKRETNRRNSQRDLAKRLRRQGVIANQLRRRDSQSVKMPQDRSGLGFPTNRKEQELPTCIGTRQTGCSQPQIIKEAPSSEMYSLARCKLSFTVGRKSHHPQPELPAINHRRRRPAVK